MPGSNAPLPLDWRQESGTYLNSATAVRPYLLEPHYRVLLDRLQFPKHCVAGLLGVREGAEW